MKFQLISILLGDESDVLIHCNLIFMNEFNDHHFHSLISSPGSI